LCGPTNLVSHLDAVGRVRYSEDKFVKVCQLIAQETLVKENT